MPSLVIPNTVQCRLVFTNNGADYAVNLLNYIVPSGVNVGAAQATAAAAAVAAAWDAGATSQRDLVADNVTLSRVGLRDIRTPNLPLYEAAVAQAGFAAADPMPAQTAYCVTLRTALAGRSFRGRVYLCGYAEGQNDVAGNPTAAVRTAALNFMNAMTTLTVTGFAYGLAVASRKLGASQFVTTVEGRDLVWDTQRRRLHGGI